jgi:hypothetical protein
MGLLLHFTGVNIICVISLYEIINLWHFVTFPILRISLDENRDFATIVMKIYDVRLKKNISWS